MGIDGYSDPCCGENNEREFIYPVGLLTAFALILIGFWHLKFPPSKASWSRMDAIKRTFIGLLLVCVGTGVELLMFRVWP